jgi:hypothetical protein
MKKMEAKTLRTKSCDEDSGGGDGESFNKLNFSLHNCLLIFHKRQKKKPWLKIQND